MSDSDTEDEMEEFIEKCALYLQKYTSGPFNTSLLRKFLGMLYVEVWNIANHIIDNGEIDVDVLEREVDNVDASTQLEGFFENVIDLIEDNNESTSTDASDDIAIDGDKDEEDR